MQPEELGGAAVLDVGTSAGTVAAGNHNHAGVYEPADADLTALAGVSATGLLARTGAGTAAARSIAVSGAGLSASNGDGVAGNPTISVADMVGDSGSGGTRGLVPAPAAGDAAAGKFLKADGSWSAPAGGSGGGADIEIRTASATVTIPDGMTKCLVTLVGGGGGGGGCSRTTGQVRAGYGGFGGGLKKLLTGLTPGNTFDLTIGAGGAGGAAGNNNGQAGGNTILASGTETITTLTASGGGAGDGVFDELSTAGITSGSGTNGDINVSPIVVSQSSGIIQQIAGVFGLGFAPTYVPLVGAGLVGTGFGVPGSGGATNSGGGNSEKAGGNGTPGLAIFEWYP